MMVLSRASFYQPARTRQLALVALVVIMLDQISKYLVLDVLSPIAGSTLTVTEFFKLVMVWNYGISFGMAAMPGTVMPMLLLALSLAISAVLWVLAHRSLDAWERACYMVILGGALGNAIDRVRYGAVADFLYFHIGPLGWPAFNIADASIFCGVALLVIRSVWPRKGA